MLHDKIITKDEVTQTEMDKMKAIRNANGFFMKDAELLDFYVEWNNVCHTLKQGRKRG